MSSAHLQLSLFELFDCEYFDSFIIVGPIVRRTDGHHQSLIVAQLGGPKERSLVYINDQYSHAFSKPAFHSDLSNASLVPHIATDEEKQLAAKVLEALPERPIFARIDVLPSDESGPLLMEVELIEPELALHFSDSSASLLAESILQKATETTG